MVRIVVVGSIHIDFYIRLSKPPKQDETVVGYGFTIMPGGKGVNQAVVASKLSSETYIVSRIGDDWLGKKL